MKKILIIIFILCSLFILSNKNQIIIPKNTIRYRIIANSDSKEDIQLKWQINEALIPYIMEINKKSTSLENTRNTIKNNIPNMERVLKSYNIDYTINYGQNHFPEKDYDHIYYPEGDYESLVISLGSGSGSNWWCVMFPPLCLLEAQYDNTQNIKYQSYIINRIKNLI